MFSTSNGGNRSSNQTALSSNRPSSSEMLLLMNRKLIFECPAPFISASSWIILDKSNCEVLFARNENESR
jgi:D-alanyl-D-alanine carboxypeptidase